MPSLRVSESEIDEFSTLLESALRSG